MCEGLSSGSAASIPPRINRAVRWASIFVGFHTGERVRVFRLARFVCENRCQVRISLKFPWFMRDYQRTFLLFVSRFDCPVLVRGFVNWRAVMGRGHECIGARRKNNSTLTPVLLTPVLPHRKAGFSTVGGVGVWSPGSGVLSTKGRCLLVTGSAAHMGAKAGWKCRVGRGFNGDIKWKIDSGPCLVA